MPSNVKTPTIWREAEAIVVGTAATRTTMTGATRTTMTGATRTTTGVSVLAKQATGWS